VKSGQIYLAPSIPDLGKLGARECADFFQPTPSLDGSRASLLRSHDGVEVWRLALGRARAAHAPAAIDGPALLTRFVRSRWSDLWHARFTHPRSQSLAEREWNLLCHLRSAGVSTPEPLAVGRAGAGAFAHRSFVLTRELTGMRTLASWRAEKLDPRATAHMARAVGDFIARIFRSRTFLPKLDAEEIAVAVPRSLTAGGSDCGDVPSGARFAKLPEVALLECRGGRIARELGWDARVAMLAALGASLPRAQDRFFSRIVHVALAHGVRDAGQRRELTRRLAACARRERATTPL
jgi:hypothetical protein